MRHALMMALPALLLAWARSIDTDLPPNTIDCAQFKKTGAEEWSVAAPTKIEIAGQAFTVTSAVTPDQTSVGGSDLYQVLESKCPH